MIGVQQLATRSSPAKALVCVGKQKGDRTAATSLIASPSSFARVDRTRGAARGSGDIRQTTSAGQATCDAGLNGDGFAESV